MRDLSLVTTFALLFLAGCATGSGTSGGGDGPALAHAPAPGTTVTYQEGDTVRMAIDAGGEVVDVTVAMAAVLDVGFDGTGDDLRVTIDFREFEIDASNPIVGSQRGDHSLIEGPLVLAMDRTGAGTVVSAPTVDGVVAQAVSPQMMATSFFPRLPGRVVAVGEEWTDTVTLAVGEEEGMTRGTTVYHFTAVGDTLIGNANYLKVTFTSRDERVSEVAQDGAAITQDVAGEGSGWYLWDSARGLVVQHFLEARLRGTMEVSMVPVPLGLDMAVVQHLRLDELGGT